MHIGEKKKGLIVLLGYASKLPSAQKLQECVQFYLWCTRHTEDKKGKEFGIKKDNIILGRKPMSD